MPGPPPHPLARARPLTPPHLCVLVSANRHFFPSGLVVVVVSFRQSLLGGAAAGLRIMLVVVPVGVDVLRGRSLGAQHVRVTAIVVSAGVNLEASLLVVVALEDLLQGNDSSDGQRNLADDQGLSGDRRQSLKSQGASDSHSGQEGSHNVTSVLLSSLISAAASTAELLLA